MEFPLIAEDYEALSNCPSVCHSINMYWSLPLESPIFYYKSWMYFFIRLAWRTPGQETRQRIPTLKPRMRQLLLSHFPEPPSCRRPKKVKPHLLNKSFKITIVLSLLTNSLFYHYPLYMCTCCICGTFILSFEHWLVSHSLKWYCRGRERCGHERRDSGSAECDTAPPTTKEKIYRSCECGSRCE